MFARIVSVRPRTFLLLVLLTAAVAALLFLIWPGPRVEELGGGPILDMRGPAAGRDAIGYLAALGDEGRRLYAILLIGDSFWTVLHGATLAVGIVIGVARSSMRPGLAGLAVLPITAAVLDLVENASFLAAIAAHPDAPPVREAVMGAVTTTKLVLVVVAYISLAIALVGWLRNRG